MTIARVVQEVNSYSLSISEIPYKKCQNPYTNSKKGHFASCTKRTRNCIWKRSWWKDWWKSPSQTGLPSEASGEIYSHRSQTTLSWPTSQAVCIPMNCHSCQHIFSSIKHEEVVRFNSDANYRRKMSNLGFMFISIYFYCTHVSVSQNARYFQISLETNNFDVKNLLLI